MNFLSCWAIPSVAQSLFLPCIQGSLLAVLGDHTWYWGSNPGQVHGRQVPTCCSKSHPNKLILHRGTPYQFCVFLKLFDSFHFPTTTTTQGVYWLGYTWLCSGITFISTQQTICLPLSSQNQPHVGKLPWFLHICPAPYSFYLKKA